MHEIPPFIPPFVPPQKPSERFKSRGEVVNAPPVGKASSKRHANDLRERSVRYADDPDLREDVQYSLLDELSKGRPLAAVLKEPWAPSATTISRWCASDPEFAAQYEQAREIGADVLGSEAIEILDNANDLNLEVAKARAGIRQWTASRLASRRYAERKLTESTVKATVEQKTINELDVSHLSIPELKALESAFLKTIELKVDEESDGDA